VNASFPHRLVFLARTCMEPASRHEGIVARSEEPSLRRPRAGTFISRMEETWR
jgi:hypothetical protein